MSSTSILSSPTGPRELLTMLEMAMAAVTVGKKERRRKKKKKKKKKKSEISQ